METLATEQIGWLEDYCWAVACFSLEQDRASSEEGRNDELLINIKVSRMDKLLSDNYSVVLCFLVTSLESIRLLCQFYHLPMNCGHDPPLYYYYLWVAPLNFFLDSICKMKAPQSYYRISWSKWNIIFYEHDKKKLKCQNGGVAHNWSRSSYCGWGFYGPESVPWQEVLDVNSEAKIKHFYFIYSQITGIKQTFEN